MPVYEVRYAKEGTMMIQASCHGRAEDILREHFGENADGYVDELEELHITDILERGGDEMDADLREDAWLQDFVDPAME